MIRAKLHLKSMGSTCHRSKFRICFLNTKNLHLRKYELLGCFNYMGISIDTHLIYLDFRGDVWIPSDLYSEILSWMIGFGCKVI